MIVKRYRMYCSKSTGSGISSNKKNGNGFIKQTKIKCNPFGCFVNNILFASHILGRLMTGSSVGVIHIQSLKWTDILPCSSALLLTRRVKSTNTLVNGHEKPWQKKKLSCRWRIMTNLTIVLWKIIWKCLRKNFDGNTVKSEGDKKSQTTMHGGK